MKHRKTDLTKSEISRSSLAVRESSLYEYKTGNWTNSLFARLLEFRNGNIPEYLACINDFSNWIKVSKPMGTDQDANYLPILFFKYFRHV